VEVRADYVAGSRLRFAGEAVTAALPGCATG
jgi:hypothetical protein